MLILVFILGDEQAQKGVVIPLNIPEYSLNATYLITDITHNINNFDENVDISVKEFKVETTR